MYYKHFLKRTPICFTDTDESKKSSKKFSAQEVFDPRSPTNEYNRTPIHLSTVNYANQNDLNTSNNENLNESSSSHESSLLLMSDSSMNVQTGIFWSRHSSRICGLFKKSPLLIIVPENGSNASCSGSADSACQNGLKLASSNLPRHILQRKQVEKLNKRKLSDFKDKENKSNLLNWTKYFV